MSSIGCRKGQETEIRVFDSKYILYEHMPSFHSSWSAEEYLEHRAEELKTFLLKLKFIKNKNDVIIGLGLGCFFLELSDRKFHRLNKILEKMRIENKKKWEAERKEHLNSSEFQEFLKEFSRVKNPPSESDNSESNTQ